jgi:hypothetical protein
MAKLSKRVKEMKAKVDRNKVYAFDNALSLVKEFATAKFNESIDVAVQLGVDPKKSDQVVRGSVVLPAGTGKTVRVAVFASGDKAELLKQPAPTSSVWKTWLRWLKPATCHSTSSSLRRTPCVSSVPWARSWAHAA